MLRQHLSNAGWSGFAAAFRAAYGLLNVLLAIRLLGAEPYGHFATLLAVFVFYASIGASMFTMLVVKLMAAGSDAREKQALLASGWIWTGCSLLILVAVCLAAWLLALGGALPAGWSAGSENFDLLCILSLLAAMQISDAFQLAMMESVGRLDLAIRTQLLGPVAVLAVLLTALFGGIGMSARAYAAALCAGAAIDLAMAWAFRRGLVSMTFGSFARRDVVSRLRQLLGSGSLLQATLLMNMFLEPFNKMLLNSLLGGGAVTVYDLAMKMIWGILSLFSAATRVFLHLSTQERGLVESSYLNAVRLFCVPVLLLHVVACLLLVALGDYWLALDTRQLALFFAVATLSNLGMIAVTPLYNSLIGAEEMRFIFRTQAILAVTNVVASLCLIPLLGVIGAAAGLLLATAFNATAILRKSRAVTGNPGLAGHLLRSLQPRLVVAGVLFGLAVYCGLDASAAALLGPAVLLAVLAMALREPVAAYLFSAVTQRAFPQR